MAAAGAARRHHWRCCGHPPRCASIDAAVAVDVVVDDSKLAAESDETSLLSFCVVVCSCACFDSAHLAWQSCESQTAKRKSGPSRTEKGSHSKKRIQSAVQPKEVSPDSTFFPRDVTFFFPFRNMTLFLSLCHTTVTLSSG